MEATHAEPNVLRFKNLRAFDREQKMRDLRKLPRLVCVDAQAKSDCKTCYGRGWPGRDHKTHEKILCHCLRIEAVEVTALEKDVQ